MRRTLAPYLHQRRTGRAYCVAKTAGSVDGRTAAPDGTSRWITGPAARADAHALRADSQAVVVGAGTAIADQPALTVRDAAAPPTPPLRVLLDARGRVPATGPLFDPELAPTLVVTTAAAPADATDDWQAHGAKVEVVDAAPTGVDLGEALTVLARHGVLQALVEGGAGLHGALLARRPHRPPRRLRRRDAARQRGPRRRRRAPARPPSATPRTGPSATSPSSTTTSASPTTRRRGA